jgi:hypothetical protein
MVHSGPVVFDGDLLAGHIDGDSDVRDGALVDVLEGVDDVLPDRRLGRLEELRGLDDVAADVGDDGERRLTATESDSH